MPELEIGSNLVALISLIVNLVLVPYVAHLSKQCHKIEDRVNGVPSG